MYLINCLNHINKATVLFHKVVRRRYSGEVGEFIIFMSKIYSGLCAPNII